MYTFSSFMLALKPTEIDQKCQVLVDQKCQVLVDQLCRWLHIIKLFKSIPCDFVYKLLRSLFAKFTKIPTSEVFTLEKTVLPRFVSSWPCSREHIRVSFLSMAFRTGYKTSSLGTNV
jgi:hypothetical protein